jgi:hypothetical protein
MAARPPASRPAFSLVSAALVAAGLALAMPGQAENAPGVADPVVSWNLSSLSDWNPASPFLDIARLMRPFEGVDDDGKRVMAAGELAAGGHLDPDGYPLRVPHGVAKLRTIWDWSRGPAAGARAGLYILTYEGSGAIRLGGGARVEAEAKGRIVFENKRGTRFWLEITATDPAGRGDHIRALSIIRAEHAALAATGAVFDPGWLKQVQGARELRFMDWMRTNNSTEVAWPDRPLPRHASWSARGAPVEIMVRLANEAGVDPWFTIPHAADDDYVTDFATYVRDHLDPRLKVHVEYSNEIWNRAFEQFDWLRAQAIADWGAEAGKDFALMDYHARQATRVALIWQEVFGPEADARLVNVLGAQTAYPGRSERLLAPATWAERDPEGYVAPDEVFEELAVTGYFGGSLVSNADLRKELLLRTRTPGGRAYGWMFEQIAFDDRLRDSIPAVLDKLAEQKAIADRHGLRLVLYEGGQHVHHSFAVRDLPEAEVEALQDVLEGFVRSPEMEALYTHIWEGWAAIGQGPFMQYTEMGAPSRWGSWGLLAHRGDRTPRADFILSRQARGGSWWGEGGGPQYLHGVIVEGSEGPDRLSGTDEEDYLLGAGGDDIFIANPGNDGINGGAGIDTYVLPGVPEDHAVEPEGAGYRVTGPMGSDFLVGIERLEFDGGVTRTLE